MKRRILLSALMMSLVLLGSSASFVLVAPVQGAPVSVTVVSDTDTEYWNGVGWVDSVSAWEPSNDVDPSLWDSLLDHAFPGSADWIWESYRVVHPVAGDIVGFRRIFDIPSCVGSLSGVLYITADNAFEVFLNGGKVGDAQIFDLTYDALHLTGGYIDTDNWWSVESWDVSSMLIPGTNELTVTVINEYMNPDDVNNVPEPQQPGTIDSNPGGLIYELQLSYEQGECFGTRGFWRNHPEFWPVEELVLGAETYSKSELLAILGSPVRGDASVNLAQQLIAAKLNIAGGADPSAVAGTIVDADTLLAGYAGKLPYFVRHGWSDGRLMTSLAVILEAYNDS